jgi:hypothetical protein
VILRFKTFENLGQFYAINETSAPISIDSIKVGPYSLSVIDLILTFDTLNAALGIDPGVRFWNEYYFAPNIDNPSEYGAPPDSLTIHPFDSLVVTWSYFDACGACKSHRNNDFNYIDSLTIHTRDSLYALYYNYEKVASVEEEPSLPGAHHFSIVRSYPNPFNPVTQLEYQVRQATDLSLRVFSQDGRVILSKKLGVRSAGTHSTSLDLRAFASGVYIVELFSGGFVDRQTITLVK